ncbi:phospholipid phosphatase-related protein type 1-like [Asterias rubens]|uniref:phospholipid phosphatase-related protein type 1-like n=1 Tax=Asterias rubens TaxID=7604 RepID=UPI00145567B8|nr:phospholipid phosphatase-related protein type 1-like [Asterias rubens]XP_033637034.1 phospholipid phosphatase-related protein type 1-like [Asterias rubens]
MADDDHRWCSTTEPFQDKRGRLVSKNSWLVPCFLGVDYVLLAGMAVLWFFLEYTEYIIAEPAVRGFWCNDPQFMKPYIDDRLVPERGLYVICFTGPVILILLGESMLALCRCDDIRESHKLVRSCSLSLHTPLRRALRFIGVFSFGAFATWVVTDVIQSLTGQMTPYFFAACNPDACSRQAGTRFVTEYTCLMGDSEFIKQARRSLPSIHASLGAYSSVFATIYLSTQVQFRNARLPVPLLCLALLSGAVLWGFSRAASYRHHWTDIFAGFALGTSFALYLSLAILNTFRENLPKTHSNMQLVSSFQDSMLSAEEEQFMRNYPSTFVLPRVRHFKNIESVSTSRMSQNGIPALNNSAFLDDVAIVHHEAPTSGVI